MKHSYDGNERFYRAILPVFWKDGMVSSAAFIDKNGLSTDCSNRRDCKICVDTLLNRLPNKDNSVVSIDFISCCEINIHAKPDPIEGYNDFHTLLVDSEEKLRISRPKARQMAETVRFDYVFNASYSIHIN